MKNIPFCLEKLAYRSHECNVLTDPLNLSVLALPACMQCIPIFVGCGSDNKVNDDSGIVSCIHTMHTKASMVVTLGLFYQEKMMKK